MKTMPSRTPDDEIRHRRRITLLVEPTDNAHEGRQAAWWRENILQVSRPQLAKIIGISSRTIERYEARKVVPKIYRLACDTISRNRNPTWHWQKRDPLKSLARGAVLSQMEQA
jgi:hypothetical protein